MKLILLCSLCFAATMSSYKFIYALELNSTVMLFNQDDINKCESRILKAKSFKNTNIQFVSSIYVDLNGRKVTRYYLKNKDARALPIDKKNLADYQNGILQCVTIAMKNFNQVYVTVLINQIKEDRLWRNFYNYDPLVKYSGYNLYEITYQPFAKLSKDYQKRLYLSLTGEMGKTIKLYPQSYSQIIKLLPSDINIGVSINHNQSFGGFFNFGLKLPVLNEFDFIGFSAYAMMPSNCRVSHFQENIKLFRKRLKKYGLTKPESQWRIHISETGIGGGMPMAFLISKLPFKGEYGKYSKAKDPWRFSRYRKIRKQFYRCVLGALKETDLVQAAFIWNADSLDVQGLYPFSQEYKNQEIALQIRQHNLEDQKRRIK